DVGGGLHQADAGQVAHPVEVFLRDRPTARVPLIESRELHAEDGALESVEAPVEADLDVVMAPALRVIAQAADACGVLAVVCHARAAFAEGAEIFSGIERRRVDGAERSGLLTAILRADRLRGVLDDGQ